MSIGAPRVKSDGCMRRRILVARGAPIFGIDVGEDFLDLAMLSARSREALVSSRCACGHQQAGCGIDREPHRRCGRERSPTCGRAGRFASHAARRRLLRREDDRAYRRTCHETHRCVAAGVATSDIQRNDAAAFDVSNPARELFRRMHRAPSVQTASARDRGGVARYSRSN